MTHPQQTTREVLEQCVQALEKLQNKLSPQVNGADEGCFIIGMHKQVSMREMENISDALTAGREALLQSTAMPVGELTPEMHLLDTPEPDKYVDCGEVRPLPMFHLSTLLQYGARLAAASSQPVREPLPLLSEAFRTTVAHGPSEDYRMVFKFKDLDSMHAADDEWRKFRGAP